MTSRPRIFGLSRDRTSTVVAQLFDGGANICITGDASCLIHAVDIPPMPITVATSDTTISIDDCCTKRGFIPLTLEDGNLYWQACYYCANIVETIISPQAVVETSDVFTSWTQTGFNDGRPGLIRFESADGRISMSIQLDCLGGLYYCTNDAYVLDGECDPRVNRVAPSTQPTHLRLPSKYKPTTKSKQLESELWLLRLGSPGVYQLDHLPGNATGLPSEFDYHPFRFIDFKEQAMIRRRAVQRSALRVAERRRRFYMDFGFLRASSPDMTRNDTKGGDRVVYSHDGYTSYLLIVDEASRYIWVFLTSSKSPPINIVNEFLITHGLADGGFVRTDQGGELAGSLAFLTACGDHHYKSEPTGSDTPSQNGSVEIYNDKFGARVRSLLYGSSLPATYWSDALRHCVYLHNRLVHSETRRTPFEGYYGIKPDLSTLRVFGSRVCVKRAGERRAKLDHNDFTGIFLGYTATDENVIYIDLNTGVVKTSHHATFDEAWYLQPTRPPAAQLLYDMGLEFEDDQHASEVSDTPDTALASVSTAEFNAAPYPPTPPLLKFGPKHIKSCPAPPTCLISPLPLRETAAPRHRTAAAARVSTAPNLQRPANAATIANEYGIGPRDIASIYLSPDPYYESSEEEVDIRRFDLNKHRTAGLSLAHIDGKLFLGGIAKSTPCAKIPRWRTRIKGAWLIKIGPHTVSTIQDAQDAFAALALTGTTTIHLLFSHPIVRQDISHDGLPIVSSAPFTQDVHDQLNNRWDFTSLADHLRTTRPFEHVLDGDVINCVTKAMKLTRGKLLQLSDWDDWQESEYLQLNQYHSQGMFGDPVLTKDGDAIFHLVWTYNIKAVDGRKKARCVCDGSTRSGKVLVLAETYANCVEQTSSRLFYAVAAAENLLVFGADVSNAFAEAPPPKQPFFIRPDRAFHEWWVKHLKRDKIPDGHMIPVLSAMQGHPESPRLWEKHADKILRMIGLTPTVHEPCLYSGTFNNQRVLFMRQVDDFAIACPDATTSDMIMDLIDDELSIPIKRQGYLDMYNGVDIYQTRHYIKINIKTFIDKAFVKHIATWMKTSYPTPNRSTPLPSDDKWLKLFNTTTGDPDAKRQAALAKEHQLSYRSGVGELIWAMTTCRPDLAYTAVKLSQSNTSPDTIHFNGLKHALKFLYNSRDDGIYFWRTTPRTELIDGPPPTINSNRQDIKLEGRPEFDALTAHAYADSDWATCPKTRRSFGGVCIRLAGGTIAYKCRFQPTVAGSSTEAEFMAACDTGKTILYVRSILWDLQIPQEAATLLYEDNDGCTAMGNAQKPTTRTRHIDIKFFSLCDWVERDLMILERIDTSINMADHLTKALQPTLFHRHADYLLGHIPPTYSPVHKSIVGLLPNYTPNIDKFTPTSFTTPLTARAARIYAPLKEDFQHNPWLSILCMGTIQPPFQPSLFSTFGLWGGVSI